MFNNERTRFLSVLFVFLFTVFLTFNITACDNGGGMNGDDNSPPNASVTANITDPVVGDTVELDASKSDDPDGDELTFSWTLETPEGSNTTLSSPTTARTWYVPDTSGDYRAEVAVGDSKQSDTDNVSITALKELPETVTVPFENVAADGDSLVTGTVTWEDSVVAEGVRSAEVTIPASRNQGQLCTQESDLFAESCKTLTPTSDFSETQSIAVQRKSVKVTVTPDPPYGDPAETDVTVYEPFMADSTKFTGENTVELAKRKTGLTRQIVTDLITDDPDKNGRLDRLTGDTTITAHADVKLSAQPSLTPACSDGINSDQDPFVKDTNEPGCAQNDGFEYNPDDDDEVHAYARRTTGINFADTALVSSKNSERTALLRENNNPFPQSITVANGPISAGVEVQRSDTVSGQGFTMRIKSGDQDDLFNSKRADSVVDQDTLDGRAIIPVTGIDRSHFAGRYYALYIDHIDEVQGKPNGNGDDWVIIGRSFESSGSWIHYFGWYYEPDHPNLNDGSSSAKIAGLSQSEFATLDNGECVDISGGTACMNGVPDDF